MKRPLLKNLLAAASIVALLGVFATSCRTPDQSGTADAAQAVYVAPGSYDSYYAFMSGGFSGQITVMGLPSGRLQKTVPVFSQHAENGWGYTEEIKGMLNTSYGFIPWDDAHHPQLSQTDGKAETGDAEREADEGT